METQIDIFGNEIPVESAFNPKKAETIKIRWRKMYGYDQGHKCGECRHCFKYIGNDRTVYKCNMMGVSDTTATDIDASDPACSRWEERKHEETAGI